MKPTKTFKPYDKKGNCTLKPAQGARPGTYIIYKSGVPVYVGFSGSNLYKTMYRHFQSWNDPTQRRVTFKQLADVSIRVIFCPASKAAILEEALILKYKPKHNDLKLQLYTSKQKQDVIEELTEATFIRIEDVPF